MVVLESLIGIIAHKLIGIITGKLVDAGIKEIVAILGVKEEMEVLQSKIELIKLVLDDAESKKIEAKSINHWFAKLREVLYDVEDLLDDFADAQRRKRNIKAKSTISKKLTEINSNLANFNIAALLQLLATLPNADKSAITERTSSYQVDSEIVGIDDDVTDLVDRIKGNCKDHSLFAITGMCGIGKTTFARKVFHHQLIQDHFNKNTVWVCVSGNCTEEYLLKKIVMSIDKNYSESRDSLDELSSKVIEVLKEKRVFIVLDDIWKSDVWEKFLRVPLYTVAKHSRILITTRNTNVAKAMNAAHTHPMTNMLPSDGWSMLCKIVFKEEDKDNMNELEMIGKEIVDRCKGLPLAIKLVGRVLRMTDRKPEAWKGVLSDKTWSMQDLQEDERPSLLLSYEDLPFHLKRCFIYCSLFPQDFTFYQAILLYMWIAEGFIEKEGETTMEESAKEYYNELVMRNLLQVRSDDNDGSSKCKMHDLLHSLAIFVSQNKYIYVNPKAFGSSGSIKHRHLRFNVNVDPKDIIGQEYVRTLMLSKINTIPDKLLSGLRGLKVLDLGDTEIETLPDSVRNLRQLRFLNISSSEFYSLPDSIQELEKLETLIVSFLKSRSLPKGIGKLCNLRHLLVSDRPQNMPKGLDNLKNLRVLDCFVVNECTSSSTRHRRILGRKKSEDCKPNMKELKDLSQLTDLSIHNLERVASKEDAEEAEIENKTSLKCLKLHCQPPLITNEDMKEIEEVIKKMKVTCAGIEIPEKLTELSIVDCTDKKKQLPKLETSLKCLESHCRRDLPISDEDIKKIEEVIKKIEEVIKKIEEVFSGIEIPENLTELSIDGFFGKQFPDHMIGSRLRQVKSLKLERCESLEQLPSLGDMPKLETLHITNLSVANFGSNFVGESKFPKLQDFRLMEMEELVNMFDVEIAGAFRCLVNLHISGCPKLKSLGEGLQHATCLKKMTVRDVNELESIENLSSISELEITRNEKLISIKNLPSLKKMDINDCSALEVVKGVRELSSLSISSDAEMITLPEWLENTIASEKWHRAVTDSEELVLMSRSKRVEVKINGVKVDRNFPGASSSSGTSSIVDGIMDERTNPVLEPKTPSNHLVDRERIVFIMVFIMVFVFTYLGIR